MKVLLVADIHYDLRKFDWIVGAAELVDLVVIAGDHLEIASPVAKPAQAVVAEKYFREIKQRAPLLISSGNHDLDGSDEGGEAAALWIAKARYYGVPTDGDSHLEGDTLFTLCPWHEGERSRAQIDGQLEADAARRPKHWIWVYHGPPEDSPTSWGGSRSFGDPELNAWIERYHPTAVLTGHVHQSPFVPDGSWADRLGETWVFNAGHQMGPVPTHVLMDLDGGCAYWLSMTGAQVAQLADPLERPLESLRALPEWLEPMARLTERQMSAGYLAGG